MNINEQSDGVEKNTEYASQWIDYLKKKNAVLTIIWPILLCTSIVFAFSTFYFFQLSETTKHQASTTLFSLQTANEKSEAIAVELKLSQQANTKLEDDVVLLSTAKTALEQQKGDSISQLDLSDQMVEALMEKIAVLETENSLITDALNKTKSMVSQQEKENQSTEDSLATKIKAHNKERFTIEKKYRDGQVAFKALISKQKEMQSEMGRLADFVEKQKNEKKVLIMAKNNAESTLKSAEILISELENKYISLEASLKLAVAPISKGSGTEKKSSDFSEHSVGNSAVMKNSDGLEEIRAPRPTSSKTKQKNNTSTKYDYDQISIDN